MTSKFHGFHMTKQLRFLMAAVSLILAQASFAAEGITARSILLGQSAAMSGPSSDLGTAMRDGALAYFEDVNAKGGVNGRLIELKTLDDGYEPDRALANTKTLLENDNVFALFGYVGTATSMAALPLLKKDEIPFFAPLSGAQSLREPLSPNVFHIRASYFAETEKIVENLEALGVKKIAVFFQNDAYGRAGLDGVERALRKRKLDVMAVATVERNSVDVASAVTKLKALQPRAVIIITAHKASTAFIRGMLKDAESIPYLWNISFVGSKVLANSLGKEGRGVMISEVVPSPWDEKLAVVKEYKRLYLSKPGREMGFISLEGFIAAKVFVEGLRRAGKDLSRVNFLKAVESMHAYDTGGFTVKFGPNDHTGSDFVDLTVINSDGQFLY